MGDRRLPAAWRLLALAALAALCAGLAGCGGGDGDGDTGASVAEPPALRVPLPRQQVAIVQVRFQVNDVNRSKVPCAAGGASRTVAGYLVGPATLLTQRRIDAGDLLLHGLGQSAAFWVADNPPGQGYAVEMARRGQVSIALDRPGYAASGPHSSAECFGAQADMAHQVLDQLRAGSYVASDGRPVPRFDRLVVTGHSAGGLSAQILAYSFGGADGLMVYSYADTGIAAPFAPYLISYAPFVAAVAGDLAHLGEIRVPVLLAIGTADEVWPPPAGETQRQLYLGAGNEDVELFEVPGVGHALVRGPPAAAIHDRALDWLVEHGFSSTPVVRAAPGG